MAKNSSVSVSSWLVVRSAFGKHFQNLGYMPVSFRKGESLVLLADSLQISEVFIWKIERIE